MNEDSTSRTHYALAIVKLMGLSGPYAGQAIEYPQKRWSDLLIIADYQLDIEKGHPIPTKDSLGKQPVCKNSLFRYRYPGQNISATDSEDLK